MVFPETLPLADEVLQDLTPYSLESCIQVDVQQIKHNQQ